LSVLLAVACILVNFAHTGEEGCRNRYVYYGF
ncbi:MAG: hypothetical protein QOE55_6887, partial [Acidobacteriaceae bacterium]|nr:hypothetical protein [Acidobacteriaceae bacterium]